MIKIAQITGLLLFLQTVFPDFASSFDTEEEAELPLINCIIGFDGKFAENEGHRLDVNYRPGHKLEDIWKELKFWRVELGFPEQITEDEIRKLNLEEDKLLFRELYAYLNPVEQLDEQVTSDFSRVIDTPQPYRMKEDDQSKIESFFVPLFSLYLIIENCEQRSSFVTVPTEYNTVGESMSLSKGMEDLERHEFVGGPLRSTPPPTMGTGHHSVTLGKGFSSASQVKLKTAVVFDKKGTEIGSEFLYSFDNPLRLLNPLPLLKLIILDMSQTVVVMTSLMLLLLFAQEGRPQFFRVRRKTRVQTKMMYGISNSLSKL